MMRCGKCNEENTEGSSICKSCSEPLIPSKNNNPSNACDACGSTYQEGAKYCTTCGKPLQTQTTQAQAPKTENSRTLSSEDGILVATIPIGETKILGRNTRECDIGLSHLKDSELVSRKHLSVQAEPDGLVIEDLRSTNNSFLDGVMLVPNTKAKAPIGSRIELAKIALIVG